MQSTHRSLLSVFFKCTDCSTDSLKGTDSKKISNWFYVLNRICLFHPCVHKQRHVSSVKRNGMWSWMHLCTFVLINYYHLHPKESWNAFISCSIVRSEAFVLLRKWQKLRHLHINKLHIRLLPKRRSNALEKGRTALALPYSIIVELVDMR